MNNSSRVLIIMICALAGTAWSYWFLQSNLVQNPVIPGIVRIHAGDSIKYLKVEAVKAIHSDTAATAETVPLIRKHEVLFHQNPVFLVWSILVVIMVTVASAAFPVFAGLSYRLIIDFSIKPWKIVTAFGCIGLIVLLMLLVSASMKGLFLPDAVIDSFHILLRKGSVLPRIVMITVILVIPILLSMFLVLPAADSLNSDSRSSPSFETRATNIQRLNHVLMSGLQVLAVIVVFSILTSSALRESIKSTISIHGFDIFPKEVSYVYGLSFSLLLAAVYLPIQFFLKQKSARFLDEVNDFHYAQKNPDDKWIKRITDKGNVANSAFDNLKLSLTVLAPLISSFLPESIRAF